MKRKARMCGCGHEAGFHELHGGKASGRCRYGAGTETGGCVCPEFHSRRRGAHASPLGDAAKPLERAAILEIAEKALKKAEEAIGAAIAAVALLRGAHVEANVVKLAQRSASRSAVMPELIVPPRIVKAARDALGKSVRIGKGELTVLQAIAQHPKGVKKEQITVLTGYKRSTRNTYLQRLSFASYIYEEIGRVFVNAAGRAALGDSFKPLPTGSALRKHWLEKLPEGEALVLELVTKAYPVWVSREEISRSTGFARSTRNTYLQRLSARELVEAPRSGETVLASPLLFD